MSNASFGMVVTVKLSATGAAKIAIIDPSEIKGVEKSVFSYKGDETNGAKIYTPKGSFKVFASVASVLKAKADASIERLAATTVPAGMTDLHTEIVELFAEVGVTLE